MALTEGESLGHVGSNIRLMLRLPPSLCPSSPSPSASLPFRSFFLPSCPLPLSPHTHPHHCMLRRPGIYSSRRAESDELYSKCDPERDNLCLYGKPPAQRATNPLSFPFNRHPSQRHSSTSLPIVYSRQMGNFEFGQDLPCKNSVRLMPSLAPLLSVSSASPLAHRPPRP